MAPAAPLGKGGGAMLTGWFRRRGEPTAPAAAPDVASPVVPSSGAGEMLLAAALDRLEEGVLVLDAGQGAVHWTPAFAALSGLPEGLAPRGTGLAALLRHSAEAGEFGLVDVEEEVARQLALVAAGPDAFPQLRHRPDGAVVEFRLARLPRGGLLLRCREVSVTMAAAPSAPAPMAAGPVVAAPAVAAAPAAPSALAAPAPRMRRSLVLLVEDMPVNQVVTATQVRREGHRVDIAGSGADAVRMAAVAPYDLVLMDLMMPGMSGHEAAAAMRTLPGPAGRVPIYALTATTGEEERARCLAAGMQGMLSKPVAAAALRDVLLRGGDIGAPAVDAVPQGGALPDGALLDGPLPDGALLHAGRLAELARDLPAATLARLCRQCLEDMAVRMDALRAALAEGDGAAIENEAHALAGMAGSYGLAGIERQARAILVPARAADAAAARAAGQGLEDGFARSRAALLVWLG